MRRSADLGWPPATAIFDEMVPRRGGYTDQKQEDRTGGRGARARHQNVNEPFKYVDHGVFPWIA